MSYYQKVLQPDETVRYVGSLHWTIYRNAILLFILAVIAAVGATQVNDQNGQYAVLGLAALLLLFAVILFLKHWFIQRTTEIVVTDKRIIHKRGWLSRHTEEMNISKVETVDVEQRIAGRMFGYGTVWIRGVGGGIEPLNHVGAPLALRNAIMVG